MDLNICTLVILKNHIFSDCPPYPQMLFPWAQHKAALGPCMASSLWFALTIVDCLVWGDPTEDTSRICKINGFLALDNGYLNDQCNNQLTVESTSVSASQQ
jgi:hypothetical protein